MRQREKQENKTKIINRVVSEQKTNVGKQKPRYKYVCITIKHERRCKENKTQKEMGKTLHNTNKTR